MADDSKELMIRISATTELLRSNITSGLAELDRLQRGAEKSGKAVEDSFKRVGVSAAQQRAGLNQLAFQMGDVATSFAGGARPMMIFAQQGGQVVQSISMMAGEATAFGRFLGGPWLQLASAAVVALSPFISELLDTEDAFDRVGDAAEEAMDRVRKSLSNTSMVTDAATENVSKLIAGMGKVAAANREIAGYQSQISDPLVDSAGTAGLAVLLKAAESRRSAAQKEVDAARGALSELKTFVGVAGMQDRARARPASPRNAAAGGRRTSRVSAASEVAPLAIERLPTSMMDALESSASGAAKAIQDGIAKEGGLYREDILHDNMTTAARIYEEAQAAADERTQQRRAAQIENLAGLYEDLFTGGISSVWDNFERRGLRAIALVLAKMTAARIAGKSFDFGEAAGSALSGILGFADGGRPPLGRVSVVGERGPELFVPDVAGTIIPNHALGGGGPSITINAPGATAETVAMIRREIYAAAPVIAQASAGMTSRGLSRRKL